MATNKCQKCNGHIYRDLDDVLTCVSCGYADYNTYRSKENKKLTKRKKELRRNDRRTA